MLTLPTRPCVSKIVPILLANSNQCYFNKLVKIPCHKTPYRCPHRLNLSSQSSRSCAGANIKVLKDKDLEFANSIRRFCETLEVLSKQGNIVWRIKLRDDSREAKWVTASYFLIMACLP